jgi:hypothetical protein
MATSRETPEAIEGQRRGVLEIPDNMFRAKTSTGRDKAMTTMVEIEREMGKRVGRLSRRKVGGRPTGLRDSSITSSRPIIKDK